MRDIHIVVREEDYPIGDVPYVNHWRNPPDENGIPLIQDIETEEALANVLEPGKTVIMLHVMGGDNSDEPITQSARVKSKAPPNTTRKYWLIDFENHEVIGDEAPINWRGVGGGWLFYYRDNKGWWGVPQKQPEQPVQLTLRSDDAIVQPVEQRINKQRQRLRNDRRITLDEANVNKLIRDYVETGLTHAELDAKYFNEVRDTHPGWKSGNILRAYGIRGSDRGQGR